MLAVLLAQCGDFNEANLIFKKLLSLDKANVQVLVNYGSALVAMGKLSEAVPLLEYVVRRSPFSVDRHIELASLLIDLKDFDRAIRYLLRAIEIDGDPEAPYLLIARVYEEIGSLEKGLSFIDLALQRSPSSVELNNRKGALLLLLGRPHMALDAFLIAHRLEPTLSNLAMNVGVALHHLRRFEEACSWHSKAIELDSANTDAYINLGSAYRELSQFDEAKKFYDRALIIDSNNSEAAFNKAVVLLQTGDFREGWELFESRFSCKSLKLVLPPRVGPRIVDLRSVYDKTVLVFAEQGFGDTLQFSRYLGKLIEFADKVVCCVPSRLVPLLQQSFPNVGFFSNAGSFPSHDLFVPMMSLPGLFATEFERVPSNVPYLTVEDNRFEKWRGALNGGQNFVIGIAWRGSNSSLVDSGRSVELSHFLQLATISGVKLVSLQRELVEGEALALSEAGILGFAQNEIDSDGAFLDTAAVIKCVDLVISTDTAIAHLAGGLGVRTFVLLKKVPDWRWLLSGSTSPWYPTAVLFRQGVRDDWRSVFGEVASAVRELVQASGKVRSLVH